VRAAWHEAPRFCSGDVAEQLHSADMVHEQYYAIAQRLTISVIVTGLLNVGQQQALALEARAQSTLSPSTDASAEAGAVHTLPATQHEASDNIISQV
jgi:hypothetical protein